MKSPKDSVPYCVTARETGRQTTCGCDSWRGANLDRVLRNDALLGQVVSDHIDPQSYRTYPAAVALPFPGQRLPGVFVLGKGGDPQLHRVGIMRSDGIDVGGGRLAPAGWQSRAEVNLLRRIRVVANEQRHPERFARSDLRLRWIEIGQMFDVVGPPECLVKSPRAAEFQGETRRRRLKAAGADVADGLRFNTLEDVAGHTSANQRFPEDKPHRFLREFFQLRIAKVVLSPIRAPCLSRYLRVRHLATGRNVLGSIFRALPFGKLQVGGVRKIVDLFGLPGTKPLAVVVDVESIARSFHLCGKRQRVRSQIKSVGGENAGRLMILVIFTYVVTG